MIRDLTTTVAQIGLEIHPDRSKILTNARPHAKSTDEHLIVDNMSIQILPHTASVKYLGKLLTFWNPQQTELDNRVSAAWRKFGCFKRELLHKNFNLTVRLRLFHSVVTPTILYGCECWTLHQQEAQHILRTQRKMLRMILGSGRKKSPQSHLLANNGKDTTTTANSMQGGDTSDHGDDSSISTQTKSNESTSDTSDEQLKSHVAWIRRTTHQIEDK
eukprot:4452922-Karenia_brevis.AAC.1